MVLHISSELHRRLLAEAAVSPDREVCGLLLGGETIERIIPTENVAMDPATTFEIDPAALLAGIRSDREGQARLLGYYHSHPVGSPQPSARDCAAAVADGRVWLIIGEGRIAAWQFADNGEFGSIELTIDT